MDKQIFERLSKRVESYKMDMIEMQKKLISFPAIAPQSGGKGEYEKAKYMEPFLSKVFDKVIECHTQHKKADGGIRPNYACYLNGRSNDKTVWLMAHMDVVPAGDEKAWSTPPFEAVVKDDRIYGRGAEDNNQAIVSSYFAIKAFKDENVLPPVRLGFLLVSDEENGSEFGAKEIISKHKHIFGKNDVIIVPDTGTPEGNEIEIAEKAVVRLKVITKGKQAHVAYPHLGINAHAVGANIIVALEELKKIYSDKDPLFSKGNTSTFEPTMKLQNVPNINTLPGEDVVFYDCRLLPSLKPELFIEKFNEIAKTTAKKFGADVNIEVVLLSRAAKPTAPEQPVVKALMQAVAEVYKTKPKVVGVGGNTVAQHFRHEGFPCALFTCWNNTLHMPNEYCTIENMINDAKVWCNSILKFN